MGKVIHKDDEIISQIYIIRGRKVMIDSDLARIYGVTTRRFNEQVRRNIERFPADFMFEITMTEYRNLMSQIVISRSQVIENMNNRNLMSQFATSSLQIATSSWGGRRKRPFVFTEHGALMLASVLNSPTAIQTSIYIVRAFVKLRELLSVYHELSEKIADLEKRTFEKLDEHSEQLMLVFQALKELGRVKDEPRNPVGFKIHTK
ncbi:MAG: ORF6N domain-containing protein [Bacteroidetes bacterium]|nr:ORF6N domain-containing protein [Bacteroidota bacterium]